MNAPRIFLAAVAATLLSTASFAAPPSADQVSVPQSQMSHRDRIQSLFDSPEEYMMFRAQMHQAMRGMPQDQKKAYRKAQFQKIKAMTEAQKDSWRHDLQAQWNALPAERKTRMAEKLDAHAPGHPPQDSQQGPYPNQDSGPAQ